MIKKLTKSQLILLRNIVKECTPDNNDKVVARFHSLENLYKKYPPLNVSFWDQEVDKCKH